LLAEQFFLLALAFVHRQSRQLIHNPRSHLHQPMPPQLPQIAILRTGTHTRGKLFSRLAGLSLIADRSECHKSVRVFGSNRGRRNQNESTGGVRKRL